MTASFTPLPTVTHPLCAGSLLVAGIGLLVTRGLTACTSKIPALCVPPRWHAQRLQTIRLPGCAVPATADVAAALGALTVAPDGGSASLTCVSRTGELVVATVHASGDVAFAPLCDPTDEAGAVACGSAYAVDEFGAVTATGLLPLASGALPLSANLSLASVSARAAAVDPRTGGVVYSTAGGVFALPPGAASFADAVRVLPEHFNRSSNLHPALLHVAPASGEIFVVGRPPKTWAPNAACAGGGAAVYRFTPPAPGADGAYTCVGRYPRLGKVFASLGRGLTGRATAAGGYLLHVSTDSEVIECAIADAAFNDHLMACHETTSVSSIMGARFAFRGVATLGE